MDTNYSLSYSRNFKKDLPFFSLFNSIQVDNKRKLKIYVLFSFFSVTSPGHQGYLGATIVSTGLSDWQALGIELCLTFVITLVYLVNHFIFLTNLLETTKKKLVKDKREILGQHFNVISLKKKPLIRTRFFFFPFT